MITQAPRKSRKQYAQTAAGWSKSTVKRRLGRSGIGARWKDAGGSLSLVLIT